MALEERLGNCWAIASQDIPFSIQLADLRIILWRVSSSPQSRLGICYGVLALDGSFFCLAMQCPLIREGELRLSAVWCLSVFCTWVLVSELQLEIWNPVQGNALKDRIYKVPLLKLCNEGFGCLRTLRVS